jgi:hypothetical protein
MTRSRVLYIANAQAALYEWRGRTLCEPQTFSADAAGRAALAESLARDPFLVTDVLVDVIEEEFRGELAPHVVGRDQAALLRRRAEQAFRLTPYRRALVQGRQAGGGREDELLLSGLTNPELLRPWLEALSEHKVPVRGMYSVVQLCADLLKPLAVDARRALLITRQKHGGLRQTFFYNHKLKMSRLTPALHADPAQHAEQLLAELAKTQRYLSRLKLMERDDVLVVHCLGEGAELETLRETCRGTPTLQFRFHALSALPPRYAVAGATSDELYLRLLRQRRPRADYATAAERKYNAYRLARWSLHGLSAAALIGGIAWSGMNLIDARLMQEFDRTAVRLSDDLDQRYERVVAETPQTPVTPQDLRTGVELARAMLARRALPHAMMYALSGGLRDFPQIRVRSIEWIPTDDPAALALEGEAPPSEPAPEQQSGPRELYQVAVVKAEIEGFEGDYKAAFALVNRFVETLRRQRDVTAVEALAMPLDTRPGASLQGVAGLNKHGESAEFRLKAVLKVTHEAG